jgi:predicted DNA-binding transcriptional regulator YafY
MAAELDVNRRTAERLRDVIRETFDLEDVVEDRRKRFRIPDGLRRIYTRPNAAEIAALQTEVAVLKRKGAAHAPQLENLLGKVKAAFDDREKRRLDPDLDALARLQRGMVGPGPAVQAAPETIATIQGAILAGCCLVFDYRAEGAAQPQWRRVIPFGLLHGAMPYLVGQMPGRTDPPIMFRLDRMSEVRASNQLGCAPDDWDLDAWMMKSFGVWREDERDIVLHVSASSADRARGWSFHPTQVVEDREGGALTVRFTSGGLREIAEHLFTWGGEVAIVAPEKLREVMRERLAAGQQALSVLRPDMSQEDANTYSGSNGDDK